MFQKLLLATFCISAGLPVYGQQKIKAKITLNDSLKTLYIQQELHYHNTSEDTLGEIYLNDWANAFSSTTTPLARRFFEDYDRDFHFAREERRGGTTINSVTSADFGLLEWTRPEGHPDLLLVPLEQRLAPGDSLRINLNYSIKIPSEEFTRFGYSNNGEYQLRYWFISPAVYRDGWQVYSHKNMDDLYIPKLDLDLAFILPAHLALISSYPSGMEVTPDSLRVYRLMGEDRLETEIYLTPTIVFEDYQVDSLHVLSNISGDGISPVLKSVMITRIIEFLQEKLGPYPHDKLLSSRQNYAANPVYGLNQLPKFIRPFPDGFTYDLEQLKTITENYLRNSLLLNPREDTWIYDGMQTYLMMEYIERFYPDLKILGNLSEVFGIRWFHAAELDFNDQYPLLYLYMARKHLDQPLSTPKDLLIQFNKNIANPYKAGVGFQYLDSFLQDSTVSRSMQAFFSRYKLQPVSAGDFRSILEANATKDITWFFEEFVGTNEKIDFTITRVRKKDDSLVVTLRNRTENHMPVPIYGLHDGDIVYKQWIPQITKEDNITIPAKGIEKVAVNHESLVPEINQRNNYMTVSGFMDKPFQFRLLKDVEDPRYYQLFFMPEFQYNLYDGLALGARIYNKTLLDRNFEFSLAPLYGLNSRTLVGSGGLSHQIFLDDDNLYAINYGISGSRFSYGYGLFYERFTPFLSLAFRSSLLRNSRKESLLVRNVNVQRDQHPEIELEVPDYSVFNINYAYRNPGLVRHYSGSVDFQLAQQFSKASVTLEYRRLLKNDRQINLRFFGGSFIYNDLPQSDYFSFALDRPTDYLYDYNYYGRSETSGLFSQQIIMAEGGFKSLLEPKFANQWITTMNGSTTLWKWIFAYGDVGLIKNKNESAKFLYDSGIRLSIVQNYFELFFPVYSSEGWEFNGGQYDQKMRFIASLDFQTLIAIFSREWF